MEYKIFVCPTEVLVTTVTSQKMPLVISGWQSQKVAQKANCADLLSGSPNSANYWLCDAELSHNYSVLILSTVKKE